MLSEYFLLNRLKDADDNPLSLATTMCEESLLYDNDGLVLYNNNQLIVLNEEYPFFKLTSKF